MHSLRRALSSPSVRSSPYPTSPSTPPSGRLATHRHRRSLGSESSSRRVLADIEWWTVVDGQREVDFDQVTEERDPNDALLAQGGLERPSTPLFWASENFQLSPVPQVRASSLDI